MFFGSKGSWLWAGVLVASLAQASSVPSFSGLKVPLRAGVVFDAGSDRGSDLRVTSGFAVGVDYYWSETWGVFLQGDFADRGYQAAGTKSTLQTVDVPFGITLQDEKVFGGNRMGTFKMGGFAAFPLASTYSGNFPGVGGARTKTFLGVFLEAMLLFPFAEGMAVGLSSWFKYSSWFSAENKFADFGLGLGARFF